MKCPKCGFVSYPGLTQCKRCGHRFPSKAEIDKPPDVRSLFSGASPAAPASPRPEPDGAPEPPVVEAVPIDETPLHSPAEVSVGRPSGESKPPSEPIAWRKELSQRVESFRQRRARLRGTSSSSANLEFDFEESGETEPPVAAEILPEEARQTPGVDVELEVPISPRADRAAAHALDAARVGDGEVVMGSPDLEAHESELGSGPYHQPVEFVLDSPPHHEEERKRELTRLNLPLAPLGRRFCGGMIDLAVLIVASGVFALIFWRAGGQMSPKLLNLMVAGFIVAFLVFAYFSVFTALTSTTPGLLWMGIEVRGFRGGPPTLHQALWRALGYLVSGSALMLGFVWAVVDSDGLTWHDRMSDTFLAASDGGA